MSHIYYYIDFKNLCLNIIHETKIKSYIIYQEQEDPQSERAFWNSMTQTEIDKICDYLFDNYSIEIEKNIKGLKNFIINMYNDVF